LFSKKACGARLKKFNTTTLLNSYKTCSAKCSQAIYEFVIKYENHLVDQGNVGSFYRPVNKKLNGSNVIAHLRNSDGNLVYADDRKAALLNEYCSGIYTENNGIISWILFQKRLMVTCPLYFSLFK